MCVSWLLTTTFMALVVKSTARQNCHTKSMNNYALNGYRYKTVHKPDYPGCVMECLKDDLCKSLNYMTTEKSCDLNNQTKESSPENFVQEPNSLYFTNILSTSVDKAPQIAKPSTKQTTQTKPSSSFTSCQDVLKSGNSTGTGAYWLDPGNTGTPVQAWCDMTTDGGGWTVVFNVKLQTTTFPPSIEVIGKWRGMISKYNMSDIFYRPVTGVWKDGKQKINYDQIHFYCYKKTVGKVVSIMTKNNTAGHKVLEYFLNDTHADSLQFPDACGSFDRLPDDTSEVAQNCNLWGSAPGKWGHKGNIGRHRMTVRPFGYGNDDYVFGIEPSKKKYFACDEPYETTAFSVGDTVRISVR